MKHKLPPFIRNLLLVALAVQIPAPALLAHTMQPQTPIPTMQRECPNQPAKQQCPEQPAKQSCIRIENPIFKTFVVSIVDQACAQGMENHIPESILRCYEQLMAGNNELPEKDLKEALPDLLACLTAKIEHMRAPRPNAQDLSSAIVGPLVCNVNNLEDLLRELRDIIEGCCEEIQIDFDFTFSLLIDLKDTLTICCENIENNFEGTFTVLQEILDTLTICCENIENNFEGTFTILADIKLTLTECCDDIQDNFDGTFTVLADIKLTITECCADIQDNFESTFTVLADIKLTITECCANLTDTLTVNFNSTFTILAEILETLTTCCADFSGSFTPTFTLLSDIFDTLTICCENIQDNFESTFTVLADIKLTITECCDDIQVNFDGTFTVLQEILETLTSCCADLTNSLTNLVSTGSTCCPCTVLTQATFDAAVDGVVVITIPGNYTLGEDVTITGTVGIVIAVSNVDLNLCSHKLSGGELTEDGILVFPDLVNIIIENGFIDPITQDGIHVLGGVTNLTIRNIDVVGAGRAGINLEGAFISGVIRDSIIENCRIELCATLDAGLGGIVLENCNTVIVQNSISTRNGSVDSTSTAGVFLITCFNCQVMDTTANDNFASVEAYGFLANGGSQNTFIRCIGSSNASDTGAAQGFAFGNNERNSSIIDCIAEGNATNAFDFANNVIATGIWIQTGASYSNLTRNTVTANSSFGIYDENMTAVLIGGVFSITSGDSTTLLSNNTAINNGDPALIPFVLAQPYPNYLIAYGGLAVLAPLGFVQFSYTLGLSPLTIITNSVFASQFSNLSIIP